MNAFRPSKRVELYWLPSADNQANVRLRFVHAGTDSWYWGIDNVGLYSMPGFRISSIVRSGLDVIVSWPAAASTRLQQSSSLTTPNWQDVPGSLGVCSVVVPTTNSAAFFRLS